jgi:hypothetical protein
VNLFFTFETFKQQTESQLCCQNKVFFFTSSKYSLEITNSLREESLEKRKSKNVSMTFKNLEKSLANNVIGFVKNKAIDYFFVLAKK